MSHNNECSFPNIFPHTLEICILSLVLVVLFTKIKSHRNERIIYPTSQESVGRPCSAQRELKAIMWFCQHNSSLCVQLNFPFLSCSLQYSKSAPEGWEVLWSRRAEEDSRGNGVVILWVDFCFRITGRNPICLICYHVQKYLKSTYGGLEYTVLCFQIY